MAQLELTLPKKKKMTPLEDVRKTGVDHKSG
jgi:hypothetical protein